MKNFFIINNPDWRKKFPTRMFIAGAFYHHTIQDSFLRQLEGKSEPQNKKNTFQYILSFILI